MAYFAAHEIAHSLTGERVGPFAYAHLPTWIREGLADYVATSGTGVDNLEALSEAFLSGSNDAFDPTRSGLYTRYRFLVAVLVKRIGRPLDELIAAPLSQAEAEAEAEDLVQSHIKRNSNP